MGVVIQFSPCFSFNKQLELRLGKPISTLKDGKAPSALTSSSISSDGDRRRRPPRRSSLPERSGKRGEDKKPPSIKSSRSTKSNPEELISVFKRIQSSISKGESVAKSEPSREQPAAGSLLNVLSRSRVRTEEIEPVRRGRNRRSNWRDTLNERRTPHQPQPASDFKLSRPVSNFVKKSPIPSSSLPSAKVLEPKREGSSPYPGISEEKPTLERLKLAELKELAKTEGIKGYSRLKKRELIEVLQSSTFS